MQVASILSDLTSLRVCDHSAALALVSVHKPERASTTVDDTTDLSVRAEDDPDMQRAMSLVELHYGVKMKHMQGEDAALKQARKAVDMVLERFEGDSLKKEGIHG